MVAPNSFSRSIDTAIATTLDTRLDYFTENGFDEWPTLKKLTGSKKSLAGGIRIEIPLEYYSTETAKALTSDLEIIVLSQPDPGTYAFYEWATVADGITIADNKVSDNQGVAKAIDYMDFLMDNWEKRYRGKMSTFMWASSPVSTDPNSIPSLLSTVGTGTVGNIVSGTYTWWKNQFKSSGSFAGQGLADIRQLYNNCSKGQSSEMPDLIITDQTGFENFEAHMSARERIVLEEKARNSQKVGYERLFFKKAEVVWDDDIASVSTTTDGRWYFLNTEYIQAYFEKGRWMRKGPLMRARDQLGQSALVDSRYNLCISNRSRLGVLHSVTYP